jgi:hypothetical protein
MGVRYDCKETAVLTRRSGFYHRGFGEGVSALNRRIRIAIVMMLATHSKAEHPE